MVPNEGDGDCVPRAWMRCMKQDGALFPRKDILFSALRNSMVAPAGRLIPNVFTLIYLNSNPGKTPKQITVKMR